jgi:hypothetical protein
MSHADGATRRSCAHARHAGDVRGRSAVRRIGTVYGNIPTIAANKNPLTWRLGGMSMRDLGRTHRGGPGEPSGSRARRQTLSSR